MKKPLLMMFSIIAGMLVVVALAVGGYMYVKRPHPKHPAQLTASQLKQLLVDLPENTTNTKDGLIQFTAHLQASDKKSKGEMDDLLPQIQDALNQSMHQFTDSELKTPDGQSRLSKDIVNRINHLLPSGKITTVYFSTWVVQ